MALVTTMPVDIDITGTRNQEIIDAAKDRAIELAIDYNQPAFKYNEKLGIFWLTSARRYKGNVNTTYRTEDSILHHHAVEAGK